MTAQELTDEQISNISSNAIRSADPLFNWSLNFARAVVAADRAQRDDQQSAEIERLRAALQSMSQTKPCDCGCNGNKAVLLKPAHYYAIAKEALQKETP